MPMTAEEGEGARGKAAVPVAVNYFGSPNNSERVVIDECGHFRLE
jgi:hypothetical protein